MKPRVGISRCLVGDLVRYDGTHKRSAAVMSLGTHVEWITVCPEVEVGMSVPREPIELVARPDDAGSSVGRMRLVGVHTGEDWTDRMDRWGCRRVAELETLEISGFVLKARSPSCGPGGVLVHHDGAGPTSTDRGLFAEALSRAMPGLPMEDEDTLADPRARDSFLQRVREFGRAR